MNKAKPIKVTHTFVNNGKTLIERLLEYILEKESTKDESTTEYVEPT